MNDVTKKGRGEEYPRDFISPSFSELISKLDAKRPIHLLIFTHRQADPDALCAAGAIASLVRKGFAETEVETMIVVPQSISLLGSAVCDHLGIDFVEEIKEPDIESADFVVAVDVGQPELLEPYRSAISNSKGKRLLIDHHSGSSMAEASRIFDEMIIDAKATSTCEIIAERAPAALIDNRVSEMLLTGILFDSQHLGIATAKTIESVLKLLRGGATIEGARSYLKMRPTRPELIARIKSAQRIRYSEFGKFIVIKAEVSSFHASVARMMLDIGGDVGIAYGVSGEGESRISARSTQRFFKETGVDLGIELKKIATREGMVGEELSGGGHSTAASFSGRSTNIESIVSSLEEELKSKIPET